MAEANLVHFIANHATRRDNQTETNMCVTSAENEKFLLINMNVSDWDGGGQAINLAVAVTDDCSMQQQQGL